MQSNDSARTAAPATGKLGMGIFLAALGMLFAASMVAYLIVRARAQAWPPPGMPRLPAGLWVSTIILLISSATMHWALTSARRDRHATLCGAMLITTLLGVLFLVSQTVNWIYLLALHMTDTPNLYAFTF
ncbi:MAG: cytochrome c oxidase subunit 3, partial [Acidobacteria bacterium]|nr:cytochrome c oxidase subunit 3 [Acidobacteriota bacterium]